MGRASLVLGFDAVLRNVMSAGAAVCGMLLAAEFALGPELLSSSWTSQASAL